MSGQYARKVARYSREDRSQHNASQSIEPMLDRLRPGVNIFAADHFRALVTYFLGDDIGRRDRALSEDRFRILNIEIKCERRLTHRNGVTVSEFARKRNVPQRTLWGRSAKAGLKFIWIGNKKLFYPEDLASLLADESGNK